MDITITEESPLGADLRLLFERHTADMHADTPPESIHMMDASELAIPEVRFFVMRDVGMPVGMGAFKRIDDTHAEIKSMHVLAEVRGRGLSRRIARRVRLSCAKSGPSSGAVTWISRPLPISIPSSGKSTPIRVPRARMIRCNWPGMM